MQAYTCTYRQMKRFGFTLAEALITVGVLGILAAVVIPPLITTVQDIVFGKAKENSLQKITEATNQMKSNDVLAGYTTNASFVTAFKDYMSVVQECNSSNLTACFPPKFKTSDGRDIDTTTLTTGDKLGSKNLTDNTIALMLKNGTAVLFSLRDSTKDTTGCDRIDPFNNTSNTTSCMSFLYDINGFKGPNVLGRDIGNVSVTAFTCGGVKTADGTCFSGAFTPTPLTLAQCNAQKATLGITACSYASEYWAGAVAHCGGVSKMPTQEQLDQFANELYGVSNCGVSTCTGNLEGAKATMAGFPSSGSFYVWSSVENSPSNSYARNFGDGYSRRENGDRYYRSTYMAVCLSP